MESESGTSGHRERWATSVRLTNPTAKDLRRTNRYTVLQSVYKHGPLSRLDVSRLSGLSTATVTNVVTELLSEGLVLEAGYEASEGGRPRTILTFHSTYGYFVGVEVGENAITINLFDATLGKLAVVKHPYSGSHNLPGSAIHHIVQGTSTLLEEYHIPQNKVLGMGLAVPGIVEHTGNETVMAPAWGWVPVPMKTLLAAHFSFPIYIDNGSKTMALAAMYLEPDLHDKTFITINLGTGIGAGIIHEGRLYRGTSNSAGEWGHTVVALDGALCRCGRRGCLEAYVGVPGILRHWREHAPEDARICEADEETSLAALLLAARQGESIAIHVLQETAHYLGAGIANLVNLFNPQTIMLSGWSAFHLGEYILADLRQVVERYALQHPFEAVTIQISELGEEAAGFGAATIAHDAFLRRMSHYGSSPSSLNGVETHVNHHLEQTTK